MVRHASLFSQMVGLFHRGQFFNLVFRHQAERSNLIDIVLGSDFVPYRPIVDVDHPS